MIPPLVALQQAESQRPLPLVVALAFNQGGLILVDPSRPEAWRKALDSPGVKDLREDLLVRWVSAGSQEITALGLREPGAYLLASNGRKLASWAAPPADLAAAIRESGWKSLDDRYLDLLRMNPGRVDFAWALFERSQSRWLREPSQERAERCSDDLDRLLGMEHWTMGRSVFIQAAQPAAPDEKGDALSRAAQKHFPMLFDVVRSQPESASAWSLIAFLLPFHPSAPRLDRLLAELVPGPESDPAFWPMQEAIALAVDQRRGASDWDGLRAMALARLERMDELEALVHPSAAEGWSGRLTVTGDKVTKFTRREESRAGKGFWLAILLEAGLASGSVSQAEEAARRLSAEGDGGGRARGLVVCRRFKREDLARILQESK
jgi:hypothetical protein